MSAITPRQREILDWLAAYIDRHQYPPTRFELMTAFGFRSPNAAQSHLKALEAHGLIALSDGAARGIRLLDRVPRADASLPLIGRVAAGAPILAAPHVEARLELDPALFKPRADYLLRVRGPSMREAGIEDGDLVAVAQRDHARSGQIVVIRIDDEVTVKRIDYRADQIWLLPANPDYTPRLVDGERNTVAVEGWVVGVIRSFEVP